MADMYYKYEKAVERDSTKKDFEVIEKENKEIEQELELLEFLRPKMSEFEYIDRLARLYNEYNHYKKAYEAYKNIESIPQFEELSNKSKLECYSLLSTIAYQAGESDVALYAAEKVIELGKDFPMGTIQNLKYLNSLLLARTILEGHRLGVYHANLLKAIEYANIMRTQMFKLEDNYISLARNYYKLNKYEDMYRASTHINNEGERTYYQVLYLSLKGKTKESIELGNEFLSRCPDDRIITVLITYISNHIRLGRVDDAYNMYYSLLPYEPNLKNKHLENYFDMYYDKGIYHYGQHQKQNYSYDKAAFHIRHRVGHDQRCALLDTDEKVKEQLKIAKEKIKNMEPYRDNLTDKYIYTEPALGDQYPTQDMIVITDPGKKSIINMYPLGYGRSKKSKTGRKP